MEAEQLETNQILRKLLAIGLAIGIGLSYLELRLIWLQESTAALLGSALGVAVLVVYALLVVTALSALIASIRRPEPPRAAALQRSSLAWIITAALIILLAWIYLFSPWQTTLTGPWTQLLVALGVARIASWLFRPEKTQPIGWEELFLAFGIFLFARIVQEIRILYPVSIASRAAILIGLAFLLGMVAVFFTPLGESLRSKLLDLRLRLGGSRVWIAGVFLLVPLLYRYSTGAGGYILYPNIRFAFLLLALGAAAYLLCTEADRLISLKTLGLSMGWLVLISAITRSLLLVVDNPFSLSWSEGNRLYDYSLVFGQELYNYEGIIPDPYGTPGRYGLWGILFLIRGLPIWAHRLWNVTLLTVPSLILAWLLTRKHQPSILRTALFLWITALFIVLAPLHPPFMVVAIIVALFAFHPSPYARGASLVAASLYAGLSRWTWVFAPGAWGALIDLLLYYPKRKGSWWQRLLPTVLMALLGALPGFLLNIRNFIGYSSGELATAQQPLLWYRLLPNSTLGPGIVLLMAITTGPLIALLIYLMAARHWKLDAWQTLAIWGALAAFLGAGLVISTKIGGGGDLHNLDMYISTLVFIISLAVLGQQQAPDVRKWPVWAIAALCFLLVFPLYQFTPFSPTANSHQWLNLPDATQTTTTLDQMRAAVDEYSERGEILFMDQRQLLTFGAIEAIPFIPGYEKKYMMDQSLAANAAYFQPYYQDLAKARFALIITEPLRTGLKGQDGVFSEENDAWVKWVSAPTLCFYEPLMTDKSVGVQLLVPRQTPKNCDKYLQQVQP